ncbi:MAG: L,D-transpeptidase [Gaiellaceae bacterium]
MIGALVVAVALATGSCPSNMADSVHPSGGSTELVSVVAPRPRTTYASLTVWRLSDGCWKTVAGPWTARIGRNGLSDHHREGDGTTPTGAFGFGPVVYGLAPNPGVHLRYHRLVCGDWWDEDPSSPTYNTFRHLDCGAKPTFGRGSEALWRQVPAYRYFAVIRYNAGPVVPGDGSAIFLHEDTGQATNGCVSLPRAELVTVLGSLRPAGRPLIVISAGR